MIRNPRAGAAVAVPPALVLQFISGVYVPFDAVPPWLQQIASVFPLRWATLGTRRALLPDSFAAAEVGGSWQTPTMYFVLVVWLGRERRDRGPSVPLEGSGVSAAIDDGPRNGTLRRVAQRTERPSSSGSSSCR